MVAKTPLSVLSRWVYQTLRRVGVSPSPALFYRAQRRFIAKEPWAETKSALLDEVSAQRRSGQSVFARDLLDRINEIGDPPNPFAAALFHRAPIPTSPPNEHRGPKPDLTPTQQEALEKAQDSPLLFLLGAPGTGKSRVTSELVRELLKGQSVLFCCSTRAALENAARDLELDHPALTVGTISGLVRSEKQQAHDTVIVDEAGMVSLAQVLYLTTLATEKMIFVGDPIQLPPVSATDNPWNSQNIFLYQAGSRNLSELYVWQQQNPNTSVLLKEQFEIPGRIFNVLNQFCYGGRLSTRNRGRGHISFIDSSSQNPKNTGRVSSPINQVHAEIVIDSLRDILSKGSVLPNSVGVISPFNEQAKFLKNAAKENGLPKEIEFGTVHTFQGLHKSCIVLDVTAAGVDHSYRILSDENQATALMNSALSRCRTSGETEGRLVVIANMSHIGIQYPDSAVDRFLSRLLFRADLLDGEDIQKYSRATNTLIDFFHRDCEQLSKQFQSGQHPSEEPTQRVIYNSCDLIQRLIQLCNRIRPRAFDVGVTLNALERPSGALSLCDLSAEHQFEPENAILFRSTVSELYKVIYESTMVSVPGENRNKSPDKPIYDPDADNGESYGRVRLWIRELRNYYQHDHEKPEDYRKGFGKRQRDFLFNNAIGRPAPEESQDSGNLTEDYSRAEYLRVTLFLLREVVIYLEAVRRRLQHS